MSRGKHSKDNEKENKDDIKEIENKVEVNNKNLDDENELPKALRKDSNGDELPKAFRKEMQTAPYMTDFDDDSKITIDNQDNEKSADKEDSANSLDNAKKEENQNIENIDSEDEDAKSENKKEKVGKMSKEEKKKNKKSKKHGKLKVFGRIVLILVIILAILIGLIYFYISNKLGKTQRVVISDSDLGISSETDQKLSGYRNIAIFGVDSRSDDYGVGNRSDCIIIASINNSTGEIKLISVYRDTYVDINGHGLDKITHAYSYGEAPLALNTLNKNLDLNIKEFATVNMDAVAKIVDQLGGIDLNLTDEEIKYLNMYIVETSKITGKSTQNISGAGTHHLDGVQAVAYSRIRYTSGGDYKRTERMRTVMNACLEKLKTKNVAEINSFADAILPSIYTNVSTGDIMSLIPNIAKYKVGESIGWPYNTKGITLDRWYGVPITLESNVTQLHKEAFGETDYTPSEEVKTISNKIVTKTGYSN